MQLHYWLLHVYKTLLGKLLYFSKLLHLSHNNYHLRSSDFITLSILKAHTVFGQNSFSFVAASDWNSLKLLALQSLHVFKEKLQQYLIDCCKC